MSQSCKPSDLCFGNAQMMSLQHLVALLFYCMVLWCLAHNQSMLRRTHQWVHSVHVHADRLISIRIILNLCELTPLAKSHQL